jgi:hypothetical protein
MAIRSHQRQRPQTAAGQTNGRSPRIGDSARDRDDGRRDGRRADDKRRVDGIARSVRDGVDGVGRAFRRPSSGDNRPRRSSCVAAAVDGRNKNDDSALPDSAPAAIEVTAGGRTATGELDATDDGTKPPNWL